MVKVISKQIECPKCYEMLEYTMADARHETKKNHGMTSWGGIAASSVTETIDTWTITCPCCGANVKVKEDRQQRLGN